MCGLSREDYYELIDARAVSNNICRNCSYWWVRHITRGECRYLSPRLLDSDGLTAQWPVTGPDDGCGDFETAFRQLKELGIIGRKEVPQDFDQDLTPILKSLRMFLVRWKVNNSWSFEDLLYKVTHGLGTEARSMVRSRVIDEIPDFDKIPNDMVKLEILRLDSVLDCKIANTGCGSRLVGPNM